jgi:hypothetical protein
LLEHIRDFLKIGLGFERLLFFILVFLISLHLAACLWLTTASMHVQNNEKQNKFVGLGVHVVQESPFKGTWLEQFHFDHLTDL